MKRYAVSIASVAILSIAAAGCGATKGSSSANYWWLSTRLREVSL